MEMGNDSVLHSALIFLITIILWSVFSYLKTPKNLPPGPRGLPYFGYLPFLGARPNITLTELRKKYGDMYKIYISGELIVILSSFKLIKEVLLKQTYEERPPPFVALTSFGPALGLFSGYGPSHREHRRFVLTTLRNIGMGKTNMEQRIQDEINRLVEEIAKLEGKPADLSNLLTMSATNVTVSILYGKRRKYDASFLELIRTSKNLVNCVGVDQWSDHFPQFIVNWLGIKTPSVLGKLLYTKILEEIKNYDKSKSTNNPENFIEAWRTEAEKSTTIKAIYGEEILAQVVSEIFLAGSTSTGVTLEWGLLYLIKHPKVQEKIQLEIDNVIGQEKSPTMSDQKLMPYTQATIMEIFRMSSIIPFNDPHSCVTEDTILNGYCIPKNASIVTNLWALHRDPEIFAQPEQFLPERFISEDNSVKRVEELIPFSIGRRQCVGETLARMSLFLHLTTLLQRFTFTKHKDLVLDYQYAIVLEPTRQKLCANLR